MEKHDTFKKLTAEIEELKQQVISLLNILESGRVITEGNLVEVKEISGTHPIRDS